MSKLEYTDNLMLSRQLPLKSVALILAGTTTGATPATAAAWQARRSPATVGSIRCR